MSGLQPKQRNPFDIDLASMPFASVIISNYNGKSFLRECLTSLEKSVYERFEIIVVDAGSSDGSPDMVRLEFPDVKLVQLGHVGIGTAINVGIRHAKGEVIVFDLNNDDVVDEDWLLNLVSAVCQCNYAVVACGKRYVYGSNRIDSAGARINRLVGSFPPIGRGEFNGPRFDTSCEVDYVPVIAASRKLVEAVGLCDEIYEIYFEDADFCCRAKKQGFKVVYVPEAEFSHYGSGSIGKISERQIYYMLRNRLRFVIKNFPMAFVLSSLMLTPLWLASEFLGQYKSVQRSHPDTISFLMENIRACFKALRWNFAHLEQTIHARSRRQ